MSFTATAMGFPLMLYLQLVRGMSPTEAALTFVPMALVSIVMAPIVGKLTDRVHPRTLTAHRFRDHRAGGVVGLPRGTPRERAVADPGADGAARLRHGLRLGPARRHRDPQPAASSSRAPGRASTTPPARSAPSSARPASPSSSTRAWRPRGCGSTAARRSPRAPAVACRPSCSTPSAPRCRRRCCSPWPCWCSASWPASASSRCGTSAIPARRAPSPRRAAATARLTLRRRWSPAGAGPSRTSARSSRPGRPRRARPTSG